MEWYYAQNEERRGPVPEAELLQLVRAGAVQPSTLVWRSGMSEWQPFSTAFSLSLGEGQVRCTECGGSFPAAEIVRIGASAVCGACKPIYIQKLSQGELTGSATGLWRFRKELIISRDASLPDRCVKCNAPSEGPKLKRNLYWHHPAVYLAIFLNIIIYAIIAMAVRKRQTVYVGLCQRHRSRRIACIVGGWSTFLLAAGMSVVTGVFYSNADWAPFVYIGSAVLLLGALVAGLVGARTIYPTKIEPQWSRVRGVCKEYLAELPEWTGN